MNACGANELLLHGLLDGELDAANTLTCEAHLSECAACVAEFRRLQAVRSKPEQRSTMVTWPRRRVRRPSKHQLPAVRSPTPA